MAEGYSKKRLAVVFLGPRGRILERFEPGSLFAEGDPGKLIEAMLRAQVRMQETKAPKLPYPIEGRELIGKTLDRKFFGRLGVSLPETGRRDITILHFLDAGNKEFRTRAHEALREREAALRDKGVRLLTVRRGARTGPKTGDTAKEGPRDPQGSVLKDLWQPERRRTWSPTFVLDRAGRIRALYPGPRALSRRNARELVIELVRRVDGALRVLLAENETPRGTAKTSKD